MVSRIMKPIKSRRYTGLLFSHNNIHSIGDKSILLMRREVKLYMLLNY